jgi:hypothetical protein
MAQFNQDYDQPIGRVINVSQELGIYAPLASRLSEHLHLAATLINRSGQYDRVYEVVEQHLKGGMIERPLLFVLQGHMSDLHRAFVLRIERIELAPGGLLDEIGEESAYESLGRCSWPAARDYLAMLRSLGEPLGLRPRAAQQEIEAAVSSKAASIGFSHHVGCARWSDSDTELLESWLGYLHASWPRARQPRLCIAFLCVEYAVKPTARTRKLQALINELSKGHDGPSAVHVLDPFDQIDNIHVGDWVASITRKYPNDFSPELLLAAESRLFRNSRPLRLADVYGQLFELMWEAYRKPAVTFGI